jgi:hypothetical protein
LNDNLNFMRILEKIQELKKLVIKEYYTKNWPAYLERVRTIYSYCREKRKLREGDLNDEELENEKFIREMNRKKLQTFRKYQQGTEDLIP